MNSQEENVFVTNKAIFLDKDGTLIKDIPYNTDPALISLMPNAAKGIAALQSGGYLPIVVSNQSGVALGYFTEADLIGVSEKIRTLLETEGVKIHGWYYCPHAAEGKIQPYVHLCNCRKPLPGLLLSAARHFMISLAESWMIGDILDDIEAGKRAGCRTILLDIGNETEWRLNEWRQPDYVAQDLAEAAAIILSSGEKEPESPGENRKDHAASESL